MAINVDKVYQTVQSILNKEQRGYLTPQRYNLFANMVQEDILEQYFYDLSQFLRIPGNSTDHADAIDILEQKISHFEKTAAGVYAANYFALPSDCFRLSHVHYGTVECAPIERKELIRLNNSLGKPSNQFPVYTLQDSGIKVYGDSEIVTGVDLLYIRKPNTVVWGYDSVLGVESYNASTSVDFELEPGEFSEVVMNILKLAGVEVRDASIYEIARGEDMQEQQLEKQ